MSGSDIGWSIEGPYDSLLDATRAAGIDQNAINPGNIDADLVYPSFFCTSQPTWLKALAYLYVRNIQFRLFFFATTASGTERWRYRVHPGMDAEMLSLMREIDATEARQLEKLQENMAIITDRLRAVRFDDDLM
jgi:hypothetical protein